MNEVYYINSINNKLTSNNSLARIIFTDNNHGN